MTVSIYILMSHNMELLCIVQGFESLEGAVLLDSFFNHTFSLLLFVACVQTAFTVHACYF